MRRRRRILIISFISVLIIAVLAFFLFHRSTHSRTFPFQPTLRTDDRLTFEIPNMTMLSPMRRLPFGIRASAYVRDTYLYVFADGQRISPRGAEIYSNAKATNHITDLHLQKPLPASGHWRFEVHRQITEFFYLPLGTLTFGPREEIWVSPVFTNEFRTSENLGSPPPTHPQD